MPLYDQENMVKLVSQMRNSDILRYRIGDFKNFRDAVAQFLQWHTPPHGPKAINTFPCMVKKAKVQNQHKKSYLTPAPAGRSRHPSEIVLRISQGEQRLHGVP
jgi:hypothetical protein